MATAGEVKIIVDVELGQATKQIKMLMNTLDKLSKDGELDLKGLSKSFDQLEKDMKDVQAQMKKGIIPPQTTSSATGGIKGMAAALNPYAAAIGGTILAVKKITDVTKRWVEVANIQELAEAKLKTVMQERVRATDEQMQSVINLTREQQKYGIIGDEVQLEAAQQVATFVTQADSINTLIPAMNNLLAQQKGVNATTADGVNIANMFGKVMTGQVGALSRVGISFSAAEEEILKYGTESERVTMLAQIITNNVGDMNTELAKTDAGQIKNIANNFSDLQEKLGDAVTSMTGALLDELQPVIMDMMGWFEENRDTITKVMKIMGVVIGGAVKLIVGYLKFYWDFFVTGFNLGKDTLTGFKDYFQSIFSDIGKVISAFGRAIVKVFKGDFAGAKDEMSGLWAELEAGEVKQAGILNKMADNTSAAFSKMVESGKVNVGENFISTIDKIADVVYSNDSQETMKKAGNKLGESITTGVAETIEEPSQAELIKAAAMKMIAESMNISVEELKALMDEAEYAKNFTSAYNSIMSDVGLLLPNPPLPPNFGTEENPVIISEEQNTETISQLGEMMNEFWDNATSSSSDFLASVLDDIDTMDQAFKELGKTIKKAFITGLANLITGNIFGTIGGAIGISVPAFANGTGGVFVDTPTLFIAGEAGGEMVEFSGNQMRATPTGSGSIVINNHIGVLAGNRNELQNFDAKYLEKARRDANFLRVK